MPPADLPADNDSPLQQPEKNCLPFRGKKWTLVKACRISLEFTSYATCADIGLHSRTDFPGYLVVSA